MKTFYLMMGLPGSGKSTYINNFLAHAVLISTDQKRLELFGSEEDQGDNKRVFAECKKDLKRAFSKGLEAVVFDATNFQKQFRQPFLALAKRFGYRTIIVFCDTDSATCIARQQTRSRKVDPAIILNFAARLEVPTPDEADQIIVIKPTRRKEMKLGIIVDTPVEALIAARAIAPTIEADEIIFFNPTSHSLLAMPKLLPEFKVAITYTPDCKTIAEAVRGSWCKHLHFGRSSALASAARSATMLDPDHVSFINNQAYLGGVTNERGYILSFLTDPVISVEDVVRLAGFPVVNQKPSALVSTVEQAVTAACQTNTVRIADDVIIWVTKNRLFAIAVDPSTDSAIQAILRSADLQAKMQYIAGRFATVGVVYPKAPYAQDITAAIQSFPESEYGKVWNQSNMERWAENDFRSITAWVRDAIERPKPVRLPEWKSWNFNG